MSKNIVIKMNFVCSQDWEEMEKVGCNRYCSQCNKIIHDFRQLSYDEIIEKKVKDPNICGILLTQQVEPGYTSISFPRKLFTTAFSIGLLIFGNSANAQTQNDSIKTEQIIVPNKDTKTSIKYKEKDLPICPINTDKQKIQSKHRRKKQLYFSRRFPFLHYGYTYRVGRF